MDNPFNIFGYAKKHGWKKTLVAWRYNFIMLSTPERLMNQKIWGFGMALVGTIMAFFYYIFKGAWHMVVLIFGLSLIFYSSWKGELKAKQQFREMKEKYGG